MVGWYILDWFLVYILIGFWLKWIVFNNQVWYFIDLLSALPCSWWCTLLSLLPIQIAVRTCFLSSDWKQSWKHIWSIHLDGAAPFDTVERVSNLHDRVMEALDGCSLDELHMCLLRAFNGPTSLPISWVHDGICKRITELDLQVNFLELPTSFFTCPTVKILKLRLTRWVPNLLEQNLEINLQSLVSLDASAHQEVYQSLFRIIGGSPALESIKFCGWAKT
ncbi:F-box/LRR-repeat protein At3g26922-like [Bidens hawaiensis]|uniref:F-box/LRR-repeat protein At3g26922-like n=1 Tax=Bidens hawaiensis TaxID=980011 RepID=UPI00404A0A82